MTRNKGKLNKIKERSEYKLRSKSKGKIVETLKIQSKSMEKNNVFIFVI